MLFPGISDLNRIITNAQNFVFSGELSGNLEVRFNELNSIVATNSASWAAAASGLLNEYVNYVKRLELNWNSLGSISLGDPVPANSQVSNILVNIDQLFDGSPTPEVTLGIVSNHSQLVSINDLNLGEIAQFNVNASQTYSGSTQLIAYFTSGILATQGHANIDVFFNVK